MSINVTETAEENKSCSVKGLKPEWRNQLSIWFNSKHPERRGGHQVYRGGTVSDL